MPERPRSTLAVVCAAVVLPLLLAACQPTAAPAPTAPAPTLAPAPAPAAAPATPAAAATTVSGTVAVVAGRVLTVTTTAGAREVTIPEGARLEQEGKGTPADLKPGLGVGITGRPDSTALSIRLFQAGSSVRPGQIPMAGEQQGNTMTNATIESFDGRTLVVALGEQRVPIVVPPETEVLKPVPAALADVAVGRRVTIAAAPSGPGGALVASSLYLPGTPPQLAR